MKPSPELAAVFEQILPWLDKGGDIQHGFNMSWHYNGCLSTCCIAGAIGLRVTDLNWEGISLWDDDTDCKALQAQDALVRNYGMTSEDMNALFYPDGDKHKITAAQAAKTVRHWIETGAVVW